MWHAVYSVLCVDRFCVVSRSQKGLDRESCKPTRGLGKGKWKAGCWALGYEGSSAADDREGSVFLISEVSVLKGGGCGRAEVGTRQHC